MKNIHLLFFKKEKILVKISILLPCEKSFIENLDLINIKRLKKGR